MSRGMVVAGIEVGTHLSARMHVNPAAMLMTEANEIVMWSGCVSERLSVASDPLESCYSLCKISARSM